MDLTDMRVMVTGGGGFLGSTISSKLEQRGAKPIVIRSSDFDLTRPERVRAALQETEAEVVVHAAAVVGGSAPTAVTPPASSTTTPLWASISSTRRTSPRYASSSS